MKNKMGLNRDYKPSMPETDYEESTVSGRFRITPSDELPAENFADRNSVPRLARVDRSDLSAELPPSINDPSKLLSSEPRIDGPYFRFPTVNGESEMDFKADIESRPGPGKRETGRDYLAFDFEEDDSFGAITPRTRNQNNRSNGNADARLQRRRVDSAQAVIRGAKRPASLQPDNFSQRSFTPDRVNSNPNGSSNGSMVLQLVLPQGILRDLGQESQSTDSPHLSSVTDLPSSEYNMYVPTILGNANGNRVRNSDIQSQKSLGLKRGFPSSASLHSEATSSHGQYPPPSSEEEKKQMFRNFISIIMSCIYAVFLVPLGLIIYIADTLIPDSYLASSFNLYLVSVGFVYLIYLFFDVRSYVNKEKKFLKATTNYDKEDDSYPPEISDEDISSPNHAFCFALGRHAGSIYLRVGATIFCFGHLIHSGLILAYEVLFFATEEFYECFSPVTLTFDVLYPIYSFFLLFFIYKYSNVIINHYKEAARVLIMHTIAASICFWIWAIFRESISLLERYANAEGSQIEDTSTDPITETEEDGLPTLRLTSISLLNLSQSNSACQSLQLNVIYATYSPYLYPFTIEYSILIVGILYIIWDNIGNCRRNPSSLADVDLCPPSAGPSAGTNIVIHADCHHANRGLFAGLLVLVFAIVSIILFFVAFGDEDYTDVGKLMNAITELILLLISTIAALIAYRQIVQLDVNHHPISLLDDILLFIAIPAFFAYALFSFIPAVINADFLKICTLVIGLVQVLIQTSLIIDGLRRCSNAKKLRSKRPGRELITFLIICNVTMWIVETFEIKSTDKKDDRYDFYGIELWTILKHMTIPLTMFYRFHSSVCLADIWKSAYEPGELHHN